MTRPVAIVTDGRRGTGVVIVRALANLGFDVLVTDIDEDRLVEDLRSELERRGARLGFVLADVADLASHRRIVDEAMTTFGRVDCLVNNASVASPGRGDPLDITPDNFDYVMDINLRGTIFLTQKVVRAMIASGSGAHRSVINITSVSAELASLDRLEYCVSRAGMAMWTKGLALRLAEHGIAVFEVRPGLLRNDMRAGSASRYGAMIAEGLVPMRRWGEPADIANAVASLATGAMAYATGSVVNVDGALSIPRL